MWYYISSFNGIYCVCPGLLDCFTEKRFKMDETKQEKLPQEEQENKKTFSRDTSRHTWIGDKNEIRPDLERTVTRMTQVLPQTDERSTRLVEKQRKAYKGFITDEEVKSAEDRAEAERRARAEERAARLEMAETRVYTGFGSGFEEEPSEPEEKKKVRTVRTYSINTGDKKVRGRLITIAVILALVLAIDVGYLFLDHGVNTLPGKTESVQKETAELLEENEELQKTADNLGDYEQLKELRESWQRLKEQLEE